MKEVRIVLLGFGSANRALARMLLEKSESPPPTTTTHPEIPRRPESGEQKRRRRRFLRLPTPTHSSSTAASPEFVAWRVVCIITRHHGRLCVPMINNGLCINEEGGYDDDDDDDDDGARIRRRPENSEEEEEMEVDLAEVLRRTDGPNFRLDDLCLTATTKEVKDRKIRTTSTARADIVSNAIGCRERSDDAMHARSTLDLIACLGQTGTANVVAEAIPSDPYHGEPAASFLAAALRNGMHVASANKGPLACDDGGTYASLLELARCRRLEYLHESAVMDGAPVFSLWRFAMPGARLHAVRGCLNSTTTLILTHMEETGESFDKALAAAKQAGIVEEDEGLDVDGIDAAAKLRALLVVLSSAEKENNDCGDVRSSRVRVVPSVKDIPADSIRNVTPKQIREAYADGQKRYRLVASAERRRADDGGNSGGIWDARVKLEQLPPEDPMYNLSGTSSSVQFCTDVLGPVTIVSTNPTLTDTAYGLFADILRVAVSIDK